MVLSIVLKLSIVVSNSLSVNPDMGDHMRKQRAVMIAALIEGMMLFVGYGKKRPKNTAHIEKEIVALCTNLAVSNDSL
jgi:hypothetical protein